MSTLPPPSPSPAPAAPLRLVLAEDSVLLREGLVRLFAEAGFNTVAAYGDADSLLDEVDALRPDLAVLDVRMPPTFRDEGVRAAIELRRRLPGIGILLLSQYVEGTYVQELLASGEGGLGYLLKDRVASLDELQDAVARAKKNVEAAGQQWSKPVEDAIRQASPNRWRDIARILQGAGVAVPR